MWSYYSITALINFSIGSLLGFFVLYKNPKARLNKSLAFWCFAVAFWSLFYFLWQIEKSNSDLALFWTRMLMFGAVWIPVAYLKVVLVFLDIEKRYKKFLNLNYFLSVIFSLLLLTPLMVSHVESMAGFIFWPKPGLAYAPFLVMFLGVSAYSAYLSFWALKTERSTIKRAQIKYLLFGIAISLAGGSTNYFLWYDIPIKPYGNLFASTYVLFTVYAIIRYRLMDIRVVVRRMFVYLGVALFAYVIFYFLVWFYNKIFGSVFANGALIAGLAIAPLFAFGFYRVDSGMRIFANKYLFSGLYNFQETISRLANQLTHHTDITEITNLITQTIQDAMGIKNVGVVLVDSQKKDKEPLVEYLKKTQRPIVLEELMLFSSDERFKEQSQNLSPIIEQMREKDASVCLPLVNNKKMVGLVSLGPRLFGDPFTVEDIDLLMTLSNQAAIAIDNAKLYEEIRDFNKTLKQKVSEQTMSLQEKTEILEEQAEHLKKLLAMRSEFLDIASHQLKTPISVISGTISMFKEGSVQKMPIETQNRLIDNIYQKSLKISQIIRDILQASEFDTEKFSFVAKKIMPVDLNKVLAEVVKDNQTLADEKKLQLIFTPHPANPQINSDPDYFEQAITNLIDNSLKYTKVGQVEIILDENPRNVIIKVKDTGVGIPKNDQGRMFGKFERAKNAVNMYTDGSGLGLFITKEIIQAHPGGTITFVSEEGQGTEFTITIPKIK